MLSRFIRSEQVRQMKRDIAVPRGERVGLARDELFKFRNLIRVLLEYVVNNFRSCKAGW